MSIRGARRQDQSAECRAQCDDACPSHMARGTSHVVPRTFCRAPLILVASLALVAGVARPAAAGGQRYALVVTGALGEDKFAARYDDWRTRLVDVLADRFGFGRDHVVALGATPKGPVQAATRENVRRMLVSLAGRLHAHDLLLVVLIGHGTFDGTVAKFNLVGPDLDAGEWAALLRNVPGQLVVVDTTGASFPFLGPLSRKDRIVVTATDSPAARYDTVFPEYFVKAMEQAAADAGPDGRVSIWDVFVAASAGVRQYYERRGLLPVEHALLDDAGDGYGKDADQPGTDSSVAQSVYLTAAPDPSADAATRELTERRDDLMAQVERLKAKKSSMSPADYDAQLEKLLVDLARVSRELRQKQGG